MLSSKRDFNKVTFLGVGMAMIIFGMFVVAIGLAAWLVQAAGLGVIFAYPFFKVVGGTVILGIGYMILELELLRKK